MILCGKKIRNIRCLGACEEPETRNQKPETRNQKHLYLLKNNQAALYDLNAINDLLSRDHQWRCKSYLISVCWLCKQAILLQFKAKLPSSILIGMIYNEPVQ